MGIDAPKAPRVDVSKVSGDADGFAQVNPQRKATWQPATEEQIRRSEEMKNNPNDGQRKDAAGGSDYFATKNELEALKSRYEIMVKSRQSLMDQLNDLKAAPPSVTPEGPVPNDEMDSMSTANPSQMTHVRYHALLSEALMYIRTVTDEGPPDDQRQSDQLCTLIQKIETVVQPEERT